MINPPFNFTGSKFPLLDQLLPLFDYSKKTFVDLFVGGGSVYVNVLDKYDEVVINDVIDDLVGIHRELMLRPNGVIEDVKTLAVCKNDQDMYNRLRDHYNEIGGSDVLWALMLSCTNNMMRFNKKGGFNQTWGKRGWNDNTQKKVFEFVNHIQKYMKKVDYRSGNFYDVKLYEPSMIYADPPYTNTEAGYNAFWSVELEKKLYDYLVNAGKNGNSFALSGVLGEHKNGKRSDIIDKLISDGYKYTILEGDYEKVARNKNTKNSQEVLIYNYDVKET